jgi:hypothetical protein
MGKLTGTRHGDAANDLLAFYEEKFLELKKSKQYFMAAIALAFAPETAILTYLLVEFGADNGAELRIPDSLSLAELTEAANEVDVLAAPINVPSHIREGHRKPKYIAKDAAEKIKRFRRVIHPGRALKESFNPRTFTRKQLKELEEMYESVSHSLMYCL